VDQRGKRNGGESTRDSERNGGAESNRAMFDFRSDRAAKTNRRTLCGRFVAMAIIVDARSPADRAIDRIVPIGFSPHKLPTRFSLTLTLAQKNIIPS